MRKRAANEWYISTLCAKFLLSLLTFFTLSNQPRRMLAQEYCPAIYVPNNCFCFFIDDGVHLECPNINLVTLQKVVSYFNGTPIHTFRVYEFDKSVTSLNEDLFPKNIVIKQLKITFSNLSQLGENAFKNVKSSLESLGIIGAKLTHVPQKTITPLTALQSVAFESSEIKDLPSYCFYGLKLVDISLKGNALYKISEYAFAGLEDTLISMDLSDNKIKNFPILPIKRLERLKDVKLAWNEISYIPDDGYSSLRNPLNLDLSSNNFVSISEDAFRPLPFIRTLSLHYNAIEGIHKNAFASLVDLESIDLGHNKIVFLDGVTFQNNAKIKTIDLNHNHVHYINGVFSNLAELKELFLSENNILDIAENAFVNSTSISIIYLQHNAIRKVEPSAFSRLSSLVRLHLSDNFIETLSPGLFSSCAKLTILNLDNNDISSIDEGAFFNATNLKELRLHNNKIRRIKKGIFQPLTNLIELYLQNNRIEDIEAGAFSTMENLQHINLQGNLLTRLGDVFQHDSSSLVSIQLDSNGMTSLHNRTLKGQSNVQIMWLGHNKLTKLDRVFFSDLLMIQKIYFTGNSISALDNGTFQPMRALSLLDLSLNELRYISKTTFTDLSNLEELYLASNKIHTVESDAFSSLKKLRILDLSDNKLLVVHRNMFQRNLPIEKLMLRNCSTATIEEGAFYGLDKLEDVNLEENNLDASSVEKIEIPSLHILNLSRNNISKFTEVTLKGIPNVQELYLEYGGVSVMEEKVFASNVRLSILSLKGNKLRSLPTETLQSLTLLNEFRLDENFFQTIPYDCITTSASSLKLLTLSGNNIIAVDFAKLSEMRYLTELDLSGNAISSVTGFTTGNMSHLSSVNLASNRLETLPTNFFQTASSIESLDLASNYFHRVPAVSISGENLPYLMWLNLTNNPLTQIHDTVSVKLYPMLKYIYISSTNLSALTSKDFQPFPYLEDLYISHNKISKIYPNAFRNLPDLRILDMSSNELETLPQERLQGLVTLRFLNLNKNKLHRVEQFHPDLKELEILDLSFNRIQEVGRDTFRNLYSLEELYLPGNLISTISGDVFRPLKKLELLDLSKNYFDNLPLNAFRPLETQIHTLRAEENPLHCGCAQQELWEWLQDHQKMIGKTGPEKKAAILRCEQPPALKGLSFLDLDPPEFCTTPLVQKLAIQDIEPYSVVVSWQSRNHTGIYGFRVTYNVITPPEYNSTMSHMYDRATRSVKLAELFPDTRYLICVIGLGNWQPTVVNSSKSPVEGTDLSSLLDVHMSRCTEVKTLDLGDNVPAKDPQENSILTRRLGLIVGSCMGFIVFVILVIVLAYMKIQKQRKNAKNQQPLPPEYLSYRHFSLQGVDPSMSTVHAQRITSLNL